MCKAKSSRNMCLARLDSYHDVLCTLLFGHPAGDYDSAVFACACMQTGTASPLVIISLLGMKATLWANCMIYSPMCSQV